MEISYRFLLFVCTLTCCSLMLITCKEDNPADSAPPEPTVGVLEISTVTTGPNKDEDGYTVTVDGAGGQSVDTTGSIVIADLEEGIHEIELTGVASNCTLEGDNPQTANIIADDTTSVSFDISCKLVLKNRIVFVSDRDGGQADLYSMDPDGTEVLRITNTAENEAFPSVSPDGTKIAYHAGGHIWVINADGTEPVQLTNSSENELPSWSPDGEQIVFHRETDGNYNIYIINVDGTDLTGITDHPSSNLNPDWSPDGEHIVFSSDRDGDYEIFVMNTSGTDLQKLTNNSFPYIEPVWSPDGSQIAFTISVGSGPLIFVMDANGENEQQISSGSTIADRHPSWSPDGTHLSFYSYRDGDYEVYVMDIDGSSPPSNITVSPSSTDVYSDWSPEE